MTPSPEKVASALSGMFSMIVSSSSLPRMPAGLPSGPGAQGVAQCLPARRVADVGLDDLLPRAVAGVFKTVHRTVTARSPASAAPMQAIRRCRWEKVQYDSPWPNG